MRPDHSERRRGSPCAGPEPSGCRAEAVADAPDRRPARGDEGFTLIELMVVVLILAVLLAIAIPTFMEAENRAKDRAAQSALRNALTVARTMATDHEGYFRANATAAITFSDLFSAESSQSFVAGAGTVDAVGVTVVGTTAPVLPGQAVLLTKRSKSSGGNFWGIVAQSDGSVAYCRADVAGDITLAAGSPATTTCDASSFADADLL